MNSTDVNTAPEDNLNNTNFINGVLAANDPHVALYNPLVPIDQNTTDFAESRIALLASWEFDLQLRTCAFNTSLLTFPPQRSSCTTCDFAPTILPCPFQNGSLPCNFTACYVDFPSFIEKSFIDILNVRNLDSMAVIVVRSNIIRQCFSHFLAKINFVLPTK
jgi:hypothetical protein